MLTLREFRSGRREPGRFERLFLDKPGGEVPLAEIPGLPIATVLVLEKGGYRTLNDILTLSREWYLHIGCSEVEAGQWLQYVSLCMEPASEDAP